jgi:hypothetical protein
MIAFIINFNRLSLTVNMANYISDCGVEPIIVDNKSNYPPLLDYYKNSPYKIERLPENYGNKAVWCSGILDKYKIDRNFIITDPDLDISNIPKDWPEVLVECLRKYPHADKIGFSLEINDLPETQLKNTIIEKEIDFWHHPINDQFFDARIDTTFALYRNRGEKIRKYEWDYSAIRTNRPYTARHVPWYYTSINDIPADERYYMKTCQNLNQIMWTTKIKDAYNL